MIPFLKASIFWLDSVVSFSMGMYIAYSMAVYIALAYYIVFSIDFLVIAFIYIEIFSSIGFIGIVFYHVFIVLAGIGLFNVVGTI